MNIEYVLNEAALYVMASRPMMIRVGVTIDPQKRAGEYRRDGYRGTMHVAPTENMRGAESYLLANYIFSHNQQQRSKQQPIEGFVYIIEGEKVD